MDMLQQSLVNLANREGLGREAGKDFKSAFSPAWCMAGNRVAFLSASFFFLILCICFVRERERERESACVCMSRGGAEREGMRENPKEAAHCQCET